MTTDTKKLRELHAKGTQGEWNNNRSSRCIQGPDNFEGDPLIIGGLVGGSHNWSSFPYSEYCVPGKNEGDANAALIVSAVNALPALLDEVEGLRAALSAELVDDRIGKWLSAALEDPTTCAEMRADIEAWFATRAAKET